MMKRKVSLILALLMLLLSFASCAQETDPSDDPSSDNSDSSYETSNSTIDIQYETIVSIGKSYTTSIAADDKYADSYGTELCDGLYAPEGASYTDEKFSGYIVNGGQTLTVTFDMGADDQQIYKFGISYLATTSAGIGPISTCRVYYSADGENWTRTGFFTTPTYEADTVQQAWLTLDAPVTAKYVRFDIKGQSGWLFLDELIIIANTAGSAVNVNYLQQLSASYQDKPSVDDIALGNTVITRDKEAVQISKGCSYVTSYSPCKTFPDSNSSLLTDGSETGSSYESGAYVGFADGQALTIDVKLGKTVDGLANFELSMYQQASLHYTLPYYVDFYISEDGTNFEKIGRVYAPDDLTVTNFTFALRLTKGFSAQVVRFSLPETDSDCFLIEEASVSYYGEDITHPLYPAVTFPEVTETLYWPNASTKEVNLVAGLPYQISASTELTYEEEGAYNSPVSAGVLTDGKYSPNTVYNNGYWNQTRNGGTRNIYFDLGYNSSITGFKINYLQYKSYGITAPTSTNLYLSENGIDWYAAGTALCTVTSDSGMFAAELTLEKPVEARFICVNFAVVPHSYADEIEVYGTQAITSKTIKLSELSDHPSTTNSFAAPSEDLLGGVSDLALIYYNIIPSDEDYFLPYVAYLDQDGNIKDTMFDGYLFLPSVASLPSGGYPYASLENPTVLSDWLYQFEQNFQEGRDFDALNKTTAQVKQALSLPDDYKVKVYATIMYPASTATNFGDFDGDGISEDFSKLEDRIKVIGGFMDMYLEAFEEANYENLSFEGFYWFEESIPYDEDYDTINATAALAESKGSQLFWIPYYTAKGFSAWNSYGFSVACMQPNYVFRDTVPVSQLYKAVDYIRQLGMCIEIEIDDTALSHTNYYKRYMRYLGYGIDAGYMTDSIHMYYQGGSVFYNACYSKTEMGRSVYDATYGFIKGTLTAPETINNFTVTCQAGDILEGSLFDDSITTAIAELTLSTEHGMLTLCQDGSYLYIPYEGFTGTDTFSFRYSNYLTWSEETTVTITVG